MSHVCVCKRFRVCHNMHDIFIYAILATAIRGRIVTRYDARFIDNKLNPFHVSFFCVCDFQRCTDPDTEFNEKAKQLNSWILYAQMVLPY